MNYQLICYLPQIFSIAAAFTSLLCGALIFFIFRNLKSQNRSPKGFVIFLSLSVPLLTGYGIWLYSFLQTIFR